MDTAKSSPVLERSHATTARPWSGFECKPCQCQSQPPQWSIHHRLFVLQKVHLCSPSGSLEWSGPTLHLLRGFLCCRASASPPEGFRLHRWTPEDHSSPMFLPVHPNLTAPHGFFTLATCPGQSLTVVCEQK
ncbi:hypothetical protein Q5P01_021792 [Channa striata]|uniref:Uncharacterized protein n=1 Tax=Channa striata TaxID=64152 RepID=A0AA88S0Y5_CHASR|nr:hypothetical protein Q5P01_021792 [Channa striata]